MEKSYVCCLAYHMAAGHRAAAAMVCAVAGLVFGAEAGTVTNGWPFLILRSYGSYEQNRVFTERAFDAQRRHPGLLDEIWFGGGDVFATPAERGRMAERENLAARETCRRLGIRFSYQQGVTLNHAPDDAEHPGFPDDCWAVYRDGRIRRGMLCCTSPFARDYLRETAKAIMSALRPDSYWADDDMRLYKGASTPNICFCDRCVKRFGAETGRDFDRASLVAALDGGDAAVRKAWCDFNGRVLGECARAYREAADAVSPATRLGIQIALSGNCYDGDSWKRMIEALAGAGGRAGIRPGALYYTDRAPRELLAKAVGVAREAARSGRLAATGQICYEAENWPHVGAHKNANGMMAECALGLAAGCDSIALYWGADQNGGEEEFDRFWFDAVAAWKPFFASVRDAFAGTRLGGVATYHGSEHFATPEWINHDESAVCRLAENALPVTVTEAEPDALFLNERSVRTLGAGDLATLFARPTMMNAATFAALGKRFPQLEFTRKVEIAGLAAERAPATTVRASGYEVFASGGRSECVRALIAPKASDVETFSTMTADPKACGTCVVPTEFGGKAVIAQDMIDGGAHRAWPNYRRGAILDALDRAVPGGMPARLKTNGYSVSVWVRKTSGGRTAGVFVMNLGTGETPPLELAIRRGTADAWTVRRAKKPDLPAEVVRRDASETVLRLPPLGAFEPALVGPGGARR